MLKFTLEIDCDARMSDGATNSVVIPNVLEGVAKLLREGCDVVRIRDQWRNMRGEAKYVEVATVIDSAEVASLDLDDAGTLTRLP